jgi:hypothetical protein
LFSKKTNVTYKTGLGDTQYTNLSGGQDELMGGINSANTGIGRVEADIGGVREDVGTIGNTVDTINTNTSGLGGRLDEGFTNLSGLMGTYNTGAMNRFNTVDAANTANANSMDAINTNTAGLQTGQNQGFASMGGRFDTVDQANTALQTTADQGFDATGKGQLELSNQMDTGFGDATTARDQSFADNRLLNDKGFSDIGAQAVENEAARAAGQTAVQGDISAMSGTADTYADAIMSKQGEMEGVQDNFVSSFDTYVDRYGEDTNLANQSRADAAMVATNRDSALREDIGGFAQAAATGQQQLGNQIQESQAATAQTLDGGFQSARQAASEEAASAAAAVNIQTRDMASMASDIETLDIGMRQDFHQLGNAFDDSGELITNQIEANGTTLERQIDDQGNLIINRFDSTGESMGQKMINIDKSIAAMKEIPSTGTNTSMGELSPSGSASQSGFASAGTRMSSPSNNLYANTAS